MLHAMGIEHLAELRRRAGLATRGAIPGVCRIGKAGRVKDVDVAVDHGLVRVAAKHCSISRRICLRSSAAAWIDCLNMT